MRYAAFLRAINVGKKNTIKKDVLKQFFVDQGCTHVRTFLQTGNVSFTYNNDPARLVDNLEKRLNAEIGDEIGVMMREFVEMKNLIASIPFGDTETPEDEIWYITFLKEPPQVDVELPIIDDKRAISIVRKDVLNLFSIRKRVDGIVGVSPNEMAERSYKVAATTRNWKTVLRFIK